MSSLHKRMLTSSCNLMPWAHDLSSSLISSCDPSHSHHAVPVHCMLCSTMMKSMLRPARSSHDNRQKERERERERERRSNPSDITQSMQRVPAFHSSPSARLLRTLVRPSVPPSVPLSLPLLPSPPPLPSSPMSSPLLSPLLSLAHIFVHVISNHTNIHQTARLLADRIPSTWSWHGTLHIQNKGDTCVCVRVCVEPKK